MSLHRPESLDAAISLLAEEGAVILGGGTDVYPGLRDGVPPRWMVDVSGVPGLRGITRDGDDWRIGAATTWTDVIRADLPPLFDGLKLAAREVGSVQIQNTATVAGNLCNASPAADGVPPLLAMDATVELTGPQGSRRMPLADFILGPRHTDLASGEMMTAIRVPDGPGQSAFRKLGARRYLVISIAMVAAVVTRDADGAIRQARLAVGSCSPVARRLSTLEAALVGADAAAVASIIDATPLPEIAPIDDLRATADYRVDAARTLVRRVILDALEVTDVA
mgnify:CR=1 FL=1